MDVVHMILERTRKGLNVFNYYMPCEFRENKKFLNPFYDDHKPSCRIYFERRADRYLLYDHGDNSYHGDCFWLVGLVKELDCKNNFIEILNIINKDLMLGLEIKSDYTPSANKPVAHTIMNQNTRTADRQHEVRPKRYHFEQHEMNQPELAFWQKYGIDYDTLRKYNVVALTSYSSEGDNGPYTIRSSNERLMFGYKGDAYIKVYRPNDTLRFLYGGSKPSNYCFGLQQLPTSGDIVFITGGEKDVMTLAAHGFSAVCFNSETASIPPDVIDVLEQRFTNIIFMYDADETGMKSMDNVLETWSEHEFVSLRLPLKGIKTEKDISDYFAMGHTSAELRKLIMKAVAAKYEDTLLMMGACEIDFQYPPVESECVVMANEVPVASCDNLVCVSGGEGTGKSHLISALLAGALLTKDVNPAIDTLGFKVLPNTKKYAVLHFDTEQSEQQLFKNLITAKKRAGIAGDMPDFYHSYYLTPYKREKRLRFIVNMISLAYLLYGGIHMVVIDGIADLIVSANDEKKSNDIVELLYKLASSYHTCIICVLHYVPGSTKLRGHLGSELQRKAATIISVEKDDDPNNRVIKTLKLRDGNPLEVPMYMFKWDKEKDMFCFAGTKSETAMAKRKDEVLNKVVNVIYNTGKEQYSYKQLSERIKAAADVKDRTASQYIHDLYERKTITKKGDYYVFNKDNKHNDGEQEE